MGIILRAPHRGAGALTGMGIGSVAAAIATALTIGAAGPASAAVVTGPFAGSYSINALPTPAGLAAVPLSATFKAGDANTVLIGVPGPVPSPGTIYSLPVVRGSDGHVSGFGTPTFFASAPGASPTSNDLDGGLAYAPNGTLFYTYTGATSGVGEILPGATSPAKVVDLAASGIHGFGLGLAFVPGGFGGQGQMKVVTTSSWYDVRLTDRGDGTYDVATATQTSYTVAAGPEAIVYVAAGNAGFATNSVIVGDESNNRLQAYSVNADGNIAQLPGQAFATLDGGHGAYGAALDPLTGDVLVLDENQIEEIRGFAVLAPEPAVAGLALAALLVGRRRRARGQARGR